MQLPVDFRLEPLPYFSSFNRIDYVVLYMSLFYRKELNAKLNIQT